MTMAIRPYTYEDLEAVVAVFRSNIPKYFTPPEEQGLRDYITEHPQNYFVGTIEDVIVACGGFALNADRTVSMCWGMVRSSHIGTGLGRELLEYRIEAARALYGDLPLVVSTSQHTRGFYERFGFNLIEHIPDGFSPGIDVCTMRR